MAKKLQKTHVAYGNYESGKDRLNIKLLLILADMGCDLHWLITGKSPPASASGPPGQYDDPVKNQLIDIIQTLARANEGLQKGLDETRAIILPKRNGTDHSAGS